MATKPAHLVERAAERLSHLGLLAGSATESRTDERGNASRQAGSGARTASWPAVAAYAVPPEPPDIRPPSPDELSRVPTRAIISMAALERAGMFDWQRGRRRILEEFRLAQQQLLRAVSATTAPPGNLVLVTSARPGEGKSFIALNLACSIALQGDHEVLLIDCDPVRQSICQALGLTGAPGILDLAASPALDADEIILRTEVDNLCVLPIGSERGRSFELFASHDMTQLLHQLGRLEPQRVVILDAPPCLSTSDPAALAAAVGQILMVVQAEQTQREEVETALELLQACPSIMLVLNKVPQSDRHAFGAYSS